MAGKENTRRPILYILKLIRIRKAIARNTGLPTGKAVEELEKLIDYHGYKTDHLASSFFIRKKREIRSLIPGIRCNSHKALMSEYLELIEYSEQTLK